MKAKREKYQNTTAARLIDKEKDGTLEIIRMSNKKKRCRHKKRIMLLSALDVEFTPDQEPFEADVIEAAGLESIVANLNMHYCPKCDQVLDIEVEGEP